MANLSERLSANFTLGELLRSSTAERDPALKEEQENPPESVLASLRYLVKTVLQPMRTKLDYPILLNSGYRSPGLNTRVGGSKTSQHVIGEAADCELPLRFLEDPNAAAVRADISAKVKEITGKPLRADLDVNFYLFAFVCLHLDELDIDQVIHEFGGGFGHPSWVHVSASTRLDRRQILAIGKYTNGSYLKPSLEEALAYGT